MNDFELDKLTLTKINNYIEKKDPLSDSFEKLKVSFLRNITLDSVKPYIKFFCLQNSINLDVEMGNFDNVFQDSINLDSKLYSNSPDIIIVCLNISSLSSRLSIGFSELTLKEINDEVIRLEKFLNDILSNLRKSSQASILINNFETPVYPSYGILDSQSQNKQINTFRKINLKLLDLTSNYANTYLVDFDKLQSQIGYEDFFDLRFWHIAKAPYSRKATKVIANEYFKYIKALRGRSKKCLVLDCDNTLWGGVIGEDGINNIAIGNSYPGSAYLEFQNAIQERNSKDVASVKLEFRIGINSGDVVKEKDNLLGDGVNIAARLEALAQTGGITISKSVYDFVQGKTRFEYNDLGVQKVKQNEFHAFDLLIHGNEKRKLKSDSKNKID